MTISQAKTGCFTAAGIGRPVVQKRKARKRRNLVTEEAVYIPGKTVVKKRTVKGM